MVTRPLSFCNARDSSVPRCSMIPVNITISEDSILAQKRELLTEDSYEWLSHSFICGIRLGGRLRWLRLHRTVARGYLATAPGLGRPCARKEPLSLRRISEHRRALVYALSRRKVRR